MKSAPRAALALVLLAFPLLAAADEPQRDTADHRALPAPTTRAEAARAWREGRHEAALLLWSLHLARFPDDAEARAAYGRALAARKRLPEAIAELRRVLASHPKDTDVRAALARYLGWTGDYAAGIAEANRALSDTPRDVEARLVLADLLSWARRFADSVPHYLIVLQARDEPEVRRRLVRTLFEARHYAEALRHARMLLGQAPFDLELRTLARESEEALLIGQVELALTAYDADRVHPWWRLQLAGQWAATSRWRVGLAVEHFWRDFQPHDAAPAPGAPSGFVRDTMLIVDAAYKSAGPWSASFQLGGSPQATFNPRVTFEGAFGYELRKGLSLGAGYKGFGYDGQYAHLFTPTLTWHFGTYVLLARYYLAVVEPFGGAAAPSREAPTSAVVGHAGSLRLRGDLLPILSWSVGVGGGLSFVTAGLGPTTNPSVSASFGLELRPTLKNGMRLDYEYVNERLGDGARFGVAWHGLRLGYFRRF